MRCGVLLAMCTGEALVLTLIALRSARELGCNLDITRWTYWVPTCAAAGAALAVGLRRQDAWAMPCVVALVTSGVCAATDLQSGYVFDRVLLAGGAGLLLANLSGGTVAGAFAGSASGCFIPLALHTVTRGRGLGFGDVKLAALLGGACTPHRALASIGMACIAAGIVGCVLLATRRRTRRDDMPFAPFLALGSYATMIMGTA